LGTGKKDFPDNQFPRNISFRGKFDRKITISGESVKNDPLPSAKSGPAAGEASSGKCLAQTSGAILFSGKKSTISYANYMIPEEYARVMLRYLSTLWKGPEFQTAGDLYRLSSSDLLRLAQKVDDSALGFLVQLLKGTPEGENLFHKLMGDHEEENRALVDEFFNRYMTVVLSSAEPGPAFNPLEYYLPPATFDDLAFVQSRQHFFLRQNIDTINDYLQTCIPDAKVFVAGEQEAAWNYFWQKLLEL
jgi:hypothetical protein